MYYLFTFRTRTNALKFAQSLKKMGQRAEIVSTPHSIANGCGLSVKVKDLVQAKKTLSYGKYATFTGAYIVKDYNGSLNIVKI